MNKYNDTKHPSGYWTKERVFAVAMKYKFWKDFIREQGAAYYVVRKHKWQSEMTWLVAGAKGNVKWTKERIIEVAKNYDYMTDFQLKESAAYRRAKKLGILNELHWLKLKQKPNGYWDNATEDQIIAEGKKYSSKSEFTSLSSAARIARKRGLLEMMVWPEIPKIRELKNNPIYTVYAYIDEVNKRAYVGLTNKLNRRDYEHRHIRQGKMDAVLTYFSSINIDIPMPIILQTGLTPEEAQEQERIFSEQYYEAGYVLLNNRHLTGKGKSSLGAFIKWTPELVTLEAKKYSSKSEFKFGNQSAYNAAITFGILNTFDWLLPKKRKEPKWSKAAVFEEASKYLNISDFRKNALVAYEKAKKNGWLKEMTWLSTDRKVNIRRWTREAVFEESHKYHSRIAFKNGCSAAYAKACENNWIIEMPWLVPLRIMKWTRDLVFEESMKYTRRSDFASHSPSAYGVARANGWLSEMIWLVQKRKPNGYWTRENVFAESHKYKSRTQFARNADAAYRKARINGWLEEMTWLS